MRKLTYFIAATLDGFIADKDGNFDFFPVGEDVLAHLVAEYPETLPAHVAPHVGVAPDAEFRHFDTVVMGRATYDPALQVGITSPYSHLRTYVVTGSITESPDPGVTLVAGDPVAKVRELKAEPTGKGIWLAGGARLAGSLMGEIDELVIKTYPILIGTGIPMLSGEFEVTAFTRTGGTVLAGGTSVATYSRT
ncbi:dihydrofolate reductase family protein [Embleya scabrispora]|uniref:dihydrofolate reductase family protein n=1 Tax=Embleya scabrispora TaxID=159449 RepID=UPI00037AA622|nr:dihydrofolate reductase family protein [Embleya scabrispora]MYS80995.1 dihydrofolate reductase [Streptomyces sp. SID5474]